MLTRTSARRVHRLTAALTAIALLFFCLYIRDTGHLEAVRGGGLVVFMMVPLLAVIWLWAQWQQDNEYAKALIFGIVTMLTYWLATFYLFYLLSTLLVDKAFLGRYVVHAVRNEFFIASAAKFIAGAIWEEAFFRGFLQKQIAKRLGITLAIALAAIAFIAAHQNSDKYISVFFALGLGFCAAATNSLIAGAIAHLFFNLIVFSYNASFITPVLYAVEEKIVINLFGVFAPINTCVGLLINTAAYKAYRAWECRQQSPEGRSSAAS